MAKEEPVTEKTEGFIKKNWQFIVGTLIMGSGLLKWILGKIKAKSSRARKREEEKEENKAEEQNQEKAEDAAKKQLAEAGVPPNSMSVASLQTWPAWHSDVHALQSGQKALPSQAASGPHRGMLSEME